MTLVINIGNTNLTLGLADETTFTPTRIPIGGFAGPLAAHALLQPVLEGKTLTACAISTVVPEKTALVAQTVQALTGLAPNIVTHEQITLDCTLYETQAGIDRLICCEAVHAEQPGIPCLVFDLGTATTANVVDANGRFLGGAITAGVTLGLEALRSGTSQLDLPAGESAPALIGTDMNACMTTGATLAAASFLIHYREKIAAHFGAAPHTVVTGGNVPRILPHLPPVFTHRPNLLLEGLLRHTKFL